MLGKFIVTLIVSLVTVAGGSLAWPRFTPAPRPPALQQVHDYVLTTDLGKQVAAVLGVEEGKAVEPLNPQKIVSGAVGSVMGAVESRTQQIIIQQAVNQLINQLGKLPSSEQQEIREQLCKP